MQHLDFWIERLAVEDDGASIRGLGAVFNEASAYGDILKPGAFAHTLSQHAERHTSPAMLYEHKSEFPIGRWTALRETPEGLAVEGRLTDATEKAREVRQLVREGIIRGLSIGFLVPEGGQERGDRGRRAITALDLFEVSIVATPALPSAQIREVRSFANVREFEDGLREAFGFSRRKAHAVASKAWHAISGEDDGPSAEDLRSAIARIDAATLKLKG